MEANYTREKDTITEIVRIPLQTRTGEKIPGAYRETRTVFEGVKAARKQVEELTIDLEGVRHAINESKKYKPKSPVDRAFKEKLKSALAAIEYEAKHEAKTKQNEEIKAEVESRLEKIKKLWPELFKPE